MDRYQLDTGVALMEPWMKTAANPHDEGFFMYGDCQPHCWSGPASQSERRNEMAAFIQTRAPTGAATSWWKY